MVYCARSSDEMVENASLNCRVSWSAYALVSIANQWPPVSLESDCMIAVRVSAEGPSIPKTRAEPALCICRAYIKTSDERRRD